MNNAVGRPFCSDADMDYAVEQYLETSRHEGTREVRADHAKKTGWYSSEVLATAITTTSMKKAGRVQYCMSLRPLYESPSDIHKAVGAVVNIDPASDCPALCLWRFCS